MVRVPSRPLLILEKSVVSLRRVNIINEIPALQEQDVVLSQSKFGIVVIPERFDIPMESFPFFLIEDWDVFLFYNSLSTFLLEIKIGLTSYS